MKKITLFLALASISNISFSETYEYSATPNIAMYTEDSANYVLTKDESSSMPDECNNLIFKSNFEPVTYFLQKSIKKENPIIGIYSVEQGFDPTTGTPSDEITCTLLGIK